MNHKPMCAVNISCAVYHSDGICPDKKKCDCGVESMKDTPEEKGRGYCLHCKLETQPLKLCKCPGRNYEDGSFISQSRTSPPLRMRDREVENMKLEHQVTSLEISKRLKELGVAQESLFNWHDDGSTDKPSICFDYRGSVDDIWFSAFTVAELGEMLPSSVMIDGPNGRVTQIKHCKSSSAGNYGVYGSLMDGSKITIEMFLAKTEADARGKMLIYLLENKLMELK